MNLKERDDIKHVTEFQDNFRDRYNQATRAKIDEQLLKDLRAIHYDIKDDELFRGVSEYKGNYQRANSAAAVGEQTISDYKLRKGNFKLGDGPAEYRTMYRDKYKLPQNNY